MTATRHEAPPPTEARRDALSVLAEASLDLLAEGLSDLAEGLAVTDLRPAEIGLVMVRGRMGGGGRAFNLGEASVTRATVRLDDGTVGVAHILGRDRRRAKLAAVADALWQRPQTRAAIEERILDKVRAARRDEEATVRAETAATRVDFFTMVRGEDR